MDGMLGVVRGALAMGDSRASTARLPPRAAASTAPGSEDELLLPDPPKRFGHASALTLMTAEHLRAGRRIFEFLVVRFRFPDEERSNLNRHQSLARCRRLESSARNSWRKPSRPRSRRRSCAHPARGIDRRCPGTVAAASPAFRRPLVPPRLENQPREGVGTSPADTPRGDARARSGLAAAASSASRRLPEPAGGTTRTREVGAAGLHRAFQRRQAYSKRSTASGSPCSGTRLQTRATHSSQVLRNSESAGLCAAMTEARSRPSKSSIP
jgi:hypothetical protein